MFIALTREGHARRRGARVTAVVLLAALPTLTGFPAHAAGQEEAPPEPRFRIASVVPDHDGAAPYQEVAAGTRRAVNEHERIALTEYFPASHEELAERLRVISEEGRIDLVVTAGAAAAQAIAETPGDLRFLLVDGIVVDDPRVRSVGINHRETAFLAGFTAGLLFEDLERAAPHREPSGTLELEGLRDDTPGISIVMADGGALVRDLIEPAFALGVHSVAPHVDIDLLLLRPRFSDETVRRIVRRKRSNAFLVLADDKRQALVSALKDHSAYVLWQNRYGTDTPNSSFLSQIGVALEEETYRRVSSAIEGSLDYGEIEELSLRDSGLSMSLEAQRLPGERRDEIRTRFNEMLQRIVSGDIEFLIPRSAIAP